MHAHYAHTRNAYVRPIKRSGTPNSNHSRCENDGLQYVQETAYPPFHEPRTKVKPPTIANELQKENLKCSRVGIYKFLKLYRRTGSIRRKAGSGRPSKVTTEIKQIVEDQTRLDDEMTAYHLHGLLTEKGYSISLRTILRCQTALGWTFRGSAYCQLIQEVNKGKRLAWAREYRIFSLLGAFRL